MRKIGIIAVLSMLVVALAAVPALAANPHFVVGPTFTDLGTTIRATGSVAGLGNEDVRVVLTATGTAEVECINPAGNRAPGQDQTVSVSGEQTITRVENGRVNFAVTAGGAQLSGTPRQVGCPNNKWTPRITDVNFTSATLRIFQGGQQVLTATQTF